MSPVTTASSPVELGSRFRVIQSQAPFIPFNAGNTQSIELPRSFPYKLIRCRLRGSATGVAATATPIKDAPCGLIKRIDLLADGRKLLMSLDGPAAYRLSNLFQGKAGELLTPPVGAVTANMFAGFFLHNEAARMLSPIMSYFDPRPYEKVELRVQWGTISDLWGTVGVTPTIGAETGLDVQVFQSAEGNEQIGFNRLMTFDEFTFAGGAVTNFTINVPRSGLLAGILIRVLDATGVPTNGFFQNSGTGTSNIVGAISLKSDNNFLHLDNVNPSTLQMANVLDYALDGVAVTSVQPAQIGFGIPGYYYIDLTEDGLMTSLLNTFDLNVLQLIVSNQGAGGIAATMRVTYIFYEPITAA